MSADGCALPVVLVAGTTMPRPPPESASLNDLREETKFRSRLIGGLQVSGAAVILIARLVYGPPWDASWPFWTVGAIALLLGVVYLLIALNEVWTRPPLSWLLGRMNDNLVEQNEAVTQIGFGMMIVDCLLCGILLIVSGGLLHSTYSPLLFAVLTIAITLRLPRKKVGAVFLTAIGVAIATILVWKFAPELGINLLEGRPPKDHLWPLVLNLSATVILTLVGAAEVIRNPIPEREIGEAFNRLGKTVKQDTHMRPALRKGMRAFMDDVGQRSTGIMLGQVHDFRTILEQAIVLMYPHQHHQQGSKDPCAEIAYLTFAAHWLDDLFDGRIWTGIENLRYDCDLRELIQESRHVKRIRRSMLRRTRSSSAIVDRAIHRLWLAASMQHRKYEGDFPGVLERYLAVVTSGAISPEVKQTYARMKEDPDQHIIIWGTAKNVLDLFDSCGPEFDATCSEIYSIFYTPFLIYQNAELEREVEQWSPAFRDKVIRSDGRGDLHTQDVIDRLRTCVTVFEQSSGTLAKQSEFVLEGRRRQLSALLELYGGPLPDSLRAEYKRLVGDDTVWLPSSS